MFLFFFILQLPKVVKFYCKEIENLVFGCICNNFSHIWVVDMCLFSWLVLMHDNWHTVHLWGFSPEWVISCPLQMFFFDWWKVALATLLRLFPIALCGYPLLKFPEENFFPSPPFSSDPIILDRIFGDCLLPSFTFYIFLRTSWILSTRDGEFATESVAIQISCRKDVNFSGDELNVKS